MCRLAWLRGLPIQHASPKSSLAIRHSSSLKIRDRSISVANVRASPPVLVNVRHSSRLSSFPFEAYHARSHFSKGKSLKLVPPTSRTYSLHPARDIDTAQENDVAMAVKTEGNDVRPVDILDEKAPLSADQAAAALDPESEEDIPVEVGELKAAVGRPPPVNSSYLPLPWKGRLGYVSRVTSSTLTTQC